jgi:integrase
MKGGRVIRYAMALAPLVFVRPGNLVSMRWSEINWDKKQWIIPRERLKDRKVRLTDHIVPLSKQALAILEGIRPLTGNGNYVFPNQRTIGAAADRPATVESLNVALRRLGVDTRAQHSSHGFRASARTMLVEQLHEPVEWAEMQLGHSVRDVLGNAYNRAEHIEARTGMMQRWADYLDVLRMGHQNKFRVRKKKAPMLAAMMHKSTS